jgi:two-component system, cell cycle sensor histidine kinase and response regulator CckA
MESPASTGRALVVDNDKVIVELISGILEHEGYQVDKALGGLEALAHLKQSRYDIVFLDLIMPRIGGDRICRYIKQSPRHGSTTVVIVSAVALEAQQKIETLKADACIAKSAYPQLKANIIKVLSLLQKQPEAGAPLFLGKNEVFSRTVVKELLFAHRHFEAILHSMSETVIELDTQQTITYANPPALQLLGKAEWEVIGRNFTEGFSSGTGLEVRALLDEMLNEHSSRTRQMTLRYGERMYSFLFTNVIRDEALIGITVVAKDLTEKNLLERERFMRERLTGVIEMAGAAAHELNQPLAVISGHAQLLLKDSDKYDETLLRRVRIIFEQVERLGRLTEKFTSIVSYETKEFGKNIKIVDIEKSSRSGNPAHLKGLWD